jgi:hypothetical protein
MKNICSIRVVLITVFVLVLISIPVQVLADGTTTTGQTFLRARLAPGMLMSQINSDASLQLTVDGNTSNVPLKITQGQPVTGEVQLPFTKGNYSVRITQNNGPSSGDILRVSGTLIPKSLGVFEHTAIEATADLNAFSFSGDGPAITIEAGSINGSLSVLLQTVSNEQFQVSLALDSDGDGIITDADVHQTQTAAGPELSVTTKSMDGLPLTSKIQVIVTGSDRTQLGKIEGPYDLANMNASAQPLQELDQNHIKAALVYINRTPMLTEIQIPSSKLAPTTEVVQVQPSNPAQSVLSAFGDTIGLKQLMQRLDSSDTHSASPSLDTSPSSETGQAGSNKFMEKLASVFTWLKNSAGPVLIIVGVFIIAGLVAIILWQTNRTHRSTY